MGMNFQSIPISTPQIINLTPSDISPLISKCQLKVMYVGANRNGSSMSKEVITEMSKTLRGTPIVGYYNEEKDDFRDHGEQIIFDGDGVQFNCLTVPYGFVAPDSDIWFQTFKEMDEYGREVEREYLMTNGFLWTGQFPECEVCLTEGRPHSMELDKKSLQGDWTKVENGAMELFIITDAIFSKLCILGEDIEPCYEGSDITAPTTDFALTFKNTLFTMMQEFKKVFEGGKDNMEDNKVITEATLENEPTVEEPVVNAEAPVEVEPAEEFAKRDDEDKDNNTEIDEDKDKTKHSLESIENEFTILKKKYEELAKQNEVLINFQKTIDMEKKQAIVDKFTMLTAEEKAPIIDKLDSYTLEEVENIFYTILGKKEFTRLNEIQNNVEEKKITSATPVTTFTISGCESKVPEYIQALRRVHENNK